MISKKFYIFWSLILIGIVVLLILLLIDSKSEGIACRQNPINYGLAQLDKQFNTESSATVSLNIAKYGSWIATAKSNKPLIQESGLQRPSLNYSLFIFSNSSTQDEGNS